MDTPLLYRRRYIPDETVCLKDDEIVRLDEDVIVTRWRALKPRKDFTHGTSCFFLKRGFKVSKFFDSEGKTVYTYCDIIETVHCPEEKKYFFNDLLVDVVIYEDGFVKVLDLAELSTALTQNLISLTQLKKALEITEQLLALIYDGKLQELTKYLEI